MRFAVGLVSFALLSTPAFSQVARPITLGVTGGSLGIGPEASYRFNPLVAVRGSATFFGVSGHGNSGSYHYSGHAHDSNFGGTIDLHPFFNGFRISAGARSTEHDRVRFTGSPTTPRTFGNVTYTPEEAGTLSGTIHTRSVSPIATIGYVHTTLIGLTFGIDGGVMFHGTPRPDDFSATGQLATNPNAQTEYANQQQKVRDDVDGYRYYPVLQLSVGYRF